MKTLWSGMAKVLIVLLVIAGWFLYQQHQEKQALQVLNQQLQTELAIVRQSLAESQKKAEELEEKSIEGMLRETNKVVVSGWETLLDTVEQELNKARDAIQQKKQQQNDEAVHGGAATEPQLKAQDSVEQETQNREPSDDQQEKAAPALIEGERT